MSEEQVQETTQEVSQENTTEVQIPEYIPEKFWDTDRNEIKVEELGASYKALEQKLGMRTEDLTKQLREDLEAERKSSVPESYEIRLPEVPEDVEISVDPEQDLVKSWQQICRDNGLSQEVFDQGVAAFVNNEESSDKAHAMSTIANKIYIRYSGVIHYTPFFLWIQPNSFFSNRRL